jgi:hypothetical protein
MELSKKAPPQSRDTKTCALCRESFATSCDARRHERESKTCGRKVHVCTICGQRFGRKGPLQRHLANHWKYYCKFKACKHSRDGHGLGSDSKLKRHLESHQALSEDRDSIPPSQAISRVSSPDYPSATQLPADHMSSNPSEVEDLLKDIAKYSREYRNFGSDIGEFSFSSRRVSSSQMLLTLLMTTSYRHKLTPTSRSLIDSKHIGGSSHDHRKRSSNAERSVIAFVERAVTTGGAVSVARRWLSNCQMSHNRCNERNGGTPPLPARVIDVGPPDGSEIPFLFISNGEPAHHLTLSYRWGSQIVTLLTTTKVSL